MSPDTITKKPLHGLIEGMYDHIYHAQTQYLNASVIGVMAASTMRRAMYERAAKRKDSDAFRIGKAVHALFLQPHLYKDLVAISPDCEKRSKEDRETWRQFHESLKPGVTDISAEEEEIVFALHESLKAQPIIYENIIASQYREVSLFNSKTSPMLKCRFDVYDPATGIACDVKTMSEPASEENFMWACKRYNYPLKAAFYRHVAQGLGHEVKRFRYICAETTPPHEVAGFELDNQVIDLWAAQLPQLLDMWQNGVDAGWPDGFRLLSAPNWQKSQLAEKVVF